MSQKNLNPKVISSADARIEGQLQLEDSLVIDPRQNGSGDAVVLQANDDNITVNGQQVVVLDGETLDPSILPDISLVDVNTVADEEEQLELEAQEGDVVVRTDTSTAYIHNGGTEGDMTDWTQISFMPVSSVAGKTGEVELEKADITDLDESDYAAAEHTHDVRDVTFDPNAPSFRNSLISFNAAYELNTFGNSFYEHDPHAVITSTHQVTVAAGNEVAVSIPLALSFTLWKIETDKEARVRIYSSEADRTADEERAEGNPPAAGTGLISEVITTSSLLSVPLTPPQLGASLDDPADARISFLVENQSETNNVEITLTWTATGYKAGVLYPIGQAFVTWPEDVQEIGEGGEETPNVGDELTGINPDWIVPQPEATYSFAWLRSDDGFASSTITGFNYNTETSTTYEVQESDVGKYIHFSVLAEDDGNGSKYITSLPVGPIRPAPEEEE